MWFFSVISSAALRQPKEKDHKHMEAFPHSQQRAMSAALKDRDWSHTSRENNPSFPVDLLLEGLIKEEKRLWLSARFSRVVAQLHILGFTIRAWEVPSALSSAFECLAGKFPSPQWLQELPEGFCIRWGICGGHFGADVCCSLLPGSRVSSARMRVKLLSLVSWAVPDHPQQPDQVLWSYLAVFIKPDSQKSWWLAFKKFTSQGLNRR